MEAPRNRRLAAVALVVAAAAVAATVGAIGGWSSSSRTASSTNVTVDLHALRQVIQGFGTSERVWADPHLSEASPTRIPESAQREILTALYRRLGLTRVRDVLDNGIQASPGAPLDFSGKRADDHIAFVKQARPYGLRTFFPGPVYLEDFMTENNVDAFVDWAMQMLEHWRAKGLEPPLYAPLNEPAISHDLSPEWMHQAVLRLGQRMRKAGLETKLVIPDDENPVAAYRRAVAVLADPAARKYVAAVAFHIYKGDESDWPPLRQLASRYGLPLWMTEIYDPAWGSWPGALGWARTVNDLITVGGVNAVDYIWGFFGDWVKPGGTMIALHFDEGVYQRLSYTPIYWITGQWSRYVRPGYRRVEARGSTDSLLVSAYTGRGRVVVVAVNSDRDPQVLRLGVTGGRVRGSVSAVRTSASEEWRPLPRETLRNGSFTAELTPHSVTTFVLHRPG